MAKRRKAQHQNQSSKERPYPTSNHGYGKPAPPRGESAKQEAQRSKFWARLRNTGRCLIRYSPVITAIATGMLMILTWRYVQYSRAQWETMQDTLRQSKDNFVGTQRAYVNIGSQDGRTMRLLPLEVGKPVTIAIYLQNSGHVPASRVIVNASAQPLINGMRSGSVKWHHITDCNPEKDALDQHPDWEESIIPAGSAQTRYIFSDSKLSPADIEAIRQADSDIMIAIMDPRNWTTE